MSDDWVNWNDEAVEAKVISEPELSQAADRRLADLRAGNHRRMQQIGARGVGPSPMALLAAQVKAVLSIIPEAGDAYDRAKAMQDPTQVVVNVLAGFTEFNTQTPEAAQAFAESYEREIADLLEEIEAEMNRALLTQPPAGDVLSRLVLPGR